MKTIPLSDITIRQSSIADICAIKTKLYLGCNYFTILNTLSKSIDNAFGKGMVTDFDIYGYDIKIKLTLKEHIDTSIACSYLTTAFENFVSDMYKLGKLSRDEYDIIRDKTYMLYNVVLNADNVIEVAL